ncbi:MAG: UDP-N-acetylglucosamine--N-acetylmuramyl-(pentapeptide) pyrophosphoryl-undecaprenol N-acetylglucosamine transferase [Erysipelotrichaceae bacterium]|nr:UDP-N-acetylglucosamine--N-acetylmuramyl-(pentapeptide) pyrophosphoryl-undecaprenol N-acetylglucosamine transferase [Erysipelotrichaceae bacterium]
MNIIMSGSGSGGHIYPCIALYNELIKDNQIIIIIFKKIDKDIYDLNHIPYIFVDDNDSSIKKLKKINQIYMKYKIDKSITFGGKNSIFIALISKKYAVDHFIFEQNAIIGKANKINYLFCKKIFTTYKLNLKKEIYVFNPNTYNINKIAERKIFDNKKITLLFTMGSQGSSSVSKVIEDFILNDKNYNIIYVTGKNVKTTINKNNVKVFSYYNPLTELIKQADIIISRGGASTISEIIALKKVAIFIPSPYVANNHQFKNVNYYYKKNCCEMILEKELTYSLLASKIRNLTHNKEKYYSMVNNIEKIEIKNNFNIIKDELFK